MHEPLLRPVGTEFEHIIEGQFTRTIEHCRVTEHALINGQVSEVVELFNVTVQRKTPPTPAERK